MLKAVAAFARKNGL